MRKRPVLLRSAANAKRSFDTDCACAPNSKEILLGNQFPAMKIVDDDGRSFNAALSPSGVLVWDDSHAGEVNREEARRVSGEESVLTSWLHLTDRCNLHCSYCYLPHVREDMPLETGRAALDAILRSARENKFQRVKLKYAGGEPLLQFPLIRDLHEYAVPLFSARNIFVEEIVLSNGTLLTGEMARSLKGMGINLMISLDGMGEIHDHHRPYAGGRGSFKDVAEAIDLALSHGLAPNLSITVSDQTAHGLANLMGWILDRDLSFNLNFYRENDLSASVQDLRFSEEKIIAGISAAFEIIEARMPRRSFLAGIVDRANLSFAHARPCGVGQDYLVFDQNGKIAKCQMSLHKPVSNLNENDPLKIIRADSTGLQNPGVDEKEGCKSCAWKYYCAGGCPLVTSRAMGRADVKSPNCNIYKALFPKALRLEALRLLKYAEDSSVAIWITG